MADILCSLKWETGFWVYLGGLDTEWTTDDRIVEWYLSEKSNSGYTVQFQTLLSGGIKESLSVDFTDLSSGTSYYIKAKVYQTVSETDIRPQKLLATLGSVRVTTYPDIPEAEIISNKPESSSIQITNNGNTDGYKIDVCGESDSSGENPLLTLTLYGETPKLTLTKLPENTKYNIFIYPFITLDGDKYYKENSPEYFKITLFTDTYEVVLAAPPVITLGDGTTEEEVWGRNDWFWYAAKFYIYPADENCELYCFRYKKESDTEWKETANYGYETGAHELIEGLDMCTVYEFQARTYSEVNGTSEWSESYYLQTLGIQYIGTSLASDVIRFSKSYIDEFLTELETANLTDIYDFKVSIARYFEGELFEATLLSVSDIQELTLNESGYYEYKLSYDYGTGNYRLKTQVYTVYDGKMYSGRDFTTGTNNIIDFTETVTASEAVSEIRYHRIDAGFYIEWDKVSNAEKYKLRILDAEGDVVLSVYKTDTSRTLTELNYSSVYTVSVQVLGNDTWSAWSEATEITVVTAPPQPIISAEYSKDNKTITVYWSLSDSNSYATYVYVNLYSNDDLSTPVQKYTYSSGEASGNVVFENIEPGIYTIKAATDYNYGGVLIQCVDSVGDNYTASLEITADGLRPENFVWTYPKVQGEEFNLTADEWNGFIYKINDFRRYLGLTDFSFSEAAEGDTFYANMYNSTGVAIQENGKYGTYIPEVIPKQQITAYMMIILVSELNAIE